MNARGLIGIVIALLGISALAAEPGAVLQLHYHERPPYYQTSAGRVSGLIADRAAASLQHAGIAYVWQQTPPLRQLQLLKANRGNDCTVGWFKTAEREQFAQFSAPLYRDQVAVLFVRQDDHRFDSINTRAELFGSKLVWLRKKGYAYAPDLDARAARGEIAFIESSSDNVAMAKMIVRKRADYFLLAGEEAESVIKLMRDEAIYLRALTLSDAEPGQLRYLLCSRRVSADTMQKINSGIAAQQWNL